MIRVSKEHLISLLLGLNSTSNGCTIEKLNYDSELAVFT